MQRVLPLHGQSATPAPLTPPRFAVARKGFRIFFLLAAAYASAIVPVWLLVLAGVLRPTNYLDATSWHAHEMLFGFTAAVIAGFLLTAVGNWTGRETLVGPPLLALSALWMLGRFAMLWPSCLPRGVPALVDLAFLPVLSIVLARPLLATKNRRNFVVVGLLLAMFVADLAMHLDALGVRPGIAHRAVVVALDLVVVLLLLIAGRVFPMFTRNATGVSDIRSHPVLDALTIVGAAGLVLLDATEEGERIAPVAAGLVGVLAVARAAHWGTWHSRRVPLLWVLHVGYAWICVGLLLRAGGGFFTSFAPSLATHAITVGAIGSLTLGMMARVALGHTGRPLVPPKPVVWAFGAMAAAGFARVVVPLIVPGAYFGSLWAAGALWTTAFVVYLVSYAPVLCAARADGKAG
jgi:uncharacterized protein involved in response to NO